MDVTTAPETLPSNPDELRALLLAERLRHAAELTATRSSAEEEIARLRQIIRELQRHRFGRRAERLDPDQLALALEDLEQTLAAKEAAASLAASVCSRSSKAKASWSGSRRSARRPKRWRCNSRMIWRNRAISSSAEERVAVNSAACRSRSASSRARSSSGLLGRVSGAVVTSTSIAAACAVLACEAASESLCRSSAGGRRPRHPHAPHPGPVQTLDER